MNGCIDIAGADKSAIQPIDPLWVTASLHTDSLSNSHYALLDYKGNTNTGRHIKHYHMELINSYYDMSNPLMRNKPGFLFFHSSTPVVWICTRFAPASYPSPSCWRHPWWVPACQTASKTADTFSTCRHHLSGSEEQAWGRSARGMQTNCATPRCMTAVSASPSTQLTSLRSLMGRGGWTHPGCMSLRYR